MLVKRRVSTQALKIDLLMWNNLNTGNDKCRRLDVLTFTNKAIFLSNIAGKIPRCKFPFI